MSDKKKMTLADFKKFKEEGKKFSFVTGYDYTTAQIINDSDVDIILVGDSLGNVMLGYGSTTPVTMEEMISHCRSVVKGAPNKWIIGDMPFGSYHESVQQAVHNAVRMIKETGCDCIKLEGGVEMVPQIEAIVRAGILVCGHIGLTPQTSTALGGMKVQGGTPETAKKLIEDAKALEAAGCYGLVIECVPSVVAAAVTKAVKIPVMGIGAGPDVDCQVLVTQDLLGMFKDFTPKFVKKFADIRTSMIDGLNAFHKEMEDGTFPDKDHSFNKQVEIPEEYK